jgi:hypothetical protein
LSRSRRGKSCTLRCDVELVDTGKFLHDHALGGDSTFPMSAARRMDMWAPTEYVLYSNSGVVAETIRDAIHQSSNQKGRCDQRGIYVYGFIWVYIDLYGSTEEMDLRQS